MFEFLTEKDIRGVIAAALIVVFAILGWRALGLVQLNDVSMEEAMLVISFVGNMVGVPIAYYFGVQSGEERSNILNLKSDPKPDKSLAGDTDDQ